MYMPFSRHPKYNFLPQYMLYIFPTFSRTILQNTSISASMIVLHIVVCLFLKREPNTLLKLLSIKLILMER